MESGKMATFYFIRHGEMDTTMAGRKFYKDFGHNMMTLSEKGSLKFMKQQRIQGWQILN